MIIKIVKSKNLVPIRITDERWTHVTENHPEVSDFFEYIIECIEDPDYIIRSKKDENTLIALRQFHNKFICVVYKEITPEDGFVVTAYFSKKINLNKENVIWQKHY